MHTKKGVFIYHSNFMKVWDFLLVLGFFLNKMFEDLMNHCENGCLWATR